MSGQQHAPAALFPRERPGTHSTGGWVGPMAVWTGGKSRPHRGSIPDRPAPSQSLYLLSCPAHPIARERLKYFCACGRVKNSPGGPLSVAVGYCLHLRRPGLKLVTLFRCGVISRVEVYLSSTYIPSLCGEL